MTDINKQLKEIIDTQGLVELSGEVKEFLSRQITPTPTVQTILPIDEIKDYVETKFHELEVILINQLPKGQLIKAPEVLELKKVLALAELSIIEHYLTDSTITHKRKMTIKVSGRDIERYEDVSISFNKWCVNGTRKSSSKVISFQEVQIFQIEEIIWHPDGMSYQRLYNFVEEKRLKLNRLIHSIMKLHVIKDVFKTIKINIEDYDDYNNQEGLQLKVRDFDDLIATVEKVGSSNIDDQILSIHEEFRTFLDKKMQILRNHKYLLKKKQPQYLISSKISYKEDSQKVGMTYRYIKNNPDITQIIPIEAKELTDGDRGDKSKYIPIPYFESNNLSRIIERPEFTITEWHYYIATSIFKRLSHNINVNTLFMGLAGTGKDYFIAWLTSLMNMENCMFDCRKLITIEDFLYIRRIKEGTDFTVTTDAYKALITSGCVLNLVEFNKLGYKASELNSLTDDKRSFYVPTEGIIYNMPYGNIIFASSNPSWFGGGRENLEYDVKDRFQNIIQYDYPPFFTDYKAVENQMSNTVAPTNVPMTDNLYYLYEAEIRYKTFPQLRELSQQEFRTSWKELFVLEYLEKNERLLYKNKPAIIKGLITLKNVLKFVNKYRMAFKLFRQGKIDIVVDIMISQRSVREILSRVIMIDPDLSDHNSYKKVIRNYIYDRSDDPDNDLVTVEQFFVD